MRGRAAPGYRELHRPWLAGAPSRELLRCRAAKPKHPHVCKAGAPDCGSGGRWFKSTQLYQYNQSLTGLRVSQPSTNPFSSDRASDLSPRLRAREAYLPNGAIGVFRRLDCGELSRSDREGVRPATRPRRLPAAADRHPAETIGRTCAIANPLGCGSTSVPGMGSNATAPHRPASGASIDAANHPQPSRPSTIRHSLGPRCAMATSTATIRLPVDHSDHRPSRKRLSDRAIAIAERPAGDFPGKIFGIVAVPHRPSGNVPGTVV